MDSILKKQKENKKITNEDLLSVLLDQRAKLDELTAKLEEKTKKIEQLEVINQKLETRLTKLECEGVKNNIILKDIPVKTTNKEGKESATETRTIVEQVLKSLEVQVEGCYEAIRFSKSVNPEKPAPILVKFWTAEGKRLFYQQLGKKKPKTKSDIVKSLKVNDQVPESLTDSFKELNKQAYEFRKSNVGAKTSVRLSWKEGKFILLAKKATETKFQQL